MSDRKKELETLTRRYWENVKAHKNAGTIYARMCSLRMRQLRAENRQDKRSAAS